MAKQIERLEIITWGPKDVLAVSIGTDTGDMCFTKDHHFDLKLSGPGAIREFYDHIEKESR